MCKTNPPISLTLSENFHKGKPFTNQVDPNQLDREGLTRNLWRKNEGIKEASPNGLWETSATCASTGMSSPTFFTRSVPISRYFESCSPTFSSNFCKAVHRSCRRAPNASSPWNLSLSILDPALSDNNCSTTADIFSPRNLRNIFIGPRLLLSLLALFEIFFDIWRRTSRLHNTEPQFLPPYDVQMILALCMVCILWRIIDLKFGPLIVDTLASKPNMVSKEVGALPYSVLSFPTVTAEASIAATSEEYPFRLWSSLPNKSPNKSISTLAVPNVVESHKRETRALHDSTYSTNTTVHINVILQC